jgi:6-phosphofructokinase
VILIPEIPFTVQNICDYVKRRDGYGKRFTIVVVAEGINLPEMKQMGRGLPVGNVVGDAIALLSGKAVRVSVLGHIQRGGSPTPYDRVLATRFGVAAVDLIAAGGFGKTVCLKGEPLRVVDIADAVGQMKTIEPHGELVEAARAIGICFWRSAEGFRAESFFFGEWCGRVPPAHSLLAKLLKVCNGWRKAESGV